MSKRRFAIRKLGTPEWSAPFRNNLLLRWLGQQEFNFLDGTPDARITFTRASQAAFTNALGAFPIIAATNEARFDNTITGTRTNFIRNGDATGAVIPTTLPTNWSTNTGAGLTREVISTDIVNGIPVVRIRYSGVANVTSALALFSESNTQVTAASGQTWTGSFYCRLVGGSLPTPQVAVTERNGAGATLQTTFAAITPSASLQRFNQTRTFTDALTAFAQVDFRVAVVNTVPYDFTIEIGGYQLEQSAVVTNYIPTSSGAVTVIDTTPDGLVIEGARTNLLLNSDTLSTQSITVTAVAHTLSFYGTGSVTLSGAATGTLNGTGALNRVTLTFTPSAGSLTLTVTGSVRFAQCGIGTFASSYIPTTGAAVTRAADVAEITNLATIGFNPNEGTIYVEYEHMGVDPAGNQWILQIDDGTGNNRLSVGTSAGATRWFTTVGGVAQPTLTVNATAAANTVYKTAMAYRAADFAVSQNGGAVVTSTGISIPTGLTRLGVGKNQATSANLFGWIRRVVYYPTRLPDAKLQSLTA